MTEGAAVHVATGRVTLVAAPFLLAAILSIYFVLPTGSPARSLLYLVPPLAILEATQRHARIPKSSGWAFLLLCAYFLCSAASRGFDEFAIKESIFLVLAFAGAIIPYKVYRQFPLTLVVAGGVSVATSIVLGSTGQSLGLSLIDSTGFAESSFGLIMPIGMIVAYKRRLGFLHFVAATVVSLLMFKRIAVIGAASIIVGDWLATRRWPRGEAGLPYRYGLPIALAVALAGININELYIKYSEIASFLFDRIVTANELSSGRYAITKVFWQRMVDSNTDLGWLFGGGVGRSSADLAQMASRVGTDLVLLHNDWIRILADYGAVGVAAVCVFSAWLMTKGRLMTLLVLYTLLCFLTDNTLTYVSYMAALTFLARAGSDEPYTRARAHASSSSS